MDNTQSTANNVVASSAFSLFFLQTFFVLLWSSGAIIIKLGLEYTNPLTFLFYRMIFAALLMLLIALATKAPWPRNWSVFTKTVITGLLTQFAYTTSYFFSLYQGVSPTVMTILLGLQPILTAIIYGLFLQQRITKTQYLGLSLGLFGVFLTVAHNVSTHAMTMAGFIYALICMASITIGSVLQKNNPDMDLRTGSAIQFAVSIIPIAILNAYFGSFVFPTAPGFALALCWMVLVVSVSATCLYYKLLREGNAIKVNSLFYLVPPITAVLCYFIFDEALNMYVAAGIAFIVISVFITQKIRDK